MFHLTNIASKILWVMTKYFFQTFYCRFKDVCYSMSQKRLVLFNQFKVYVVIWSLVTEITIGLLELSMVVVSSQINNTHLISWLHNLLILKTIYQILVQVLSNTGLCPDGRHQILQIKMARKVSYTHQIIIKLCHKNIQNSNLSTQLHLSGDIRFLTLL